MADTPLINPNPTTDTTEIPTIKFTEAELVALNNDIQIMTNMRVEKETPDAELDMMTAAQYFESNRKKDLSFIPKKKNKEDIRIVTGTTREKDTTLLSTLLNLNATPDVTAFDEEDLIVAELGGNMSDLVKKSREIEDWQKKRPIVYREMISQGDVFILETAVDDFRNVPLSELNWDPLRDGVSKFTFRERLTKVASLCTARMVQQPNIFVGSKRIEYIEDQDTVAIVTIYKRNQAETMYHEWERWVNVPKTIDTTSVIQQATGVYKNWSMFNTGAEEVSEVVLMRKGANRVQIYLNGIPMLPYNYPLTAICPSGEIPMAQGKLEPISGYWLSKSQPSKTKVDQEVLDETITLMVTGMRQSRKPPMGTKSKKAYSQNIFAAGTITSDIKPGTFHSILPESALGIKSGEFSFYNLLKEQINEKTVNDVYAGNDDGNTDTLGQAQIEKEQQILKLGTAMDAVVNFERRLAWIRIDNIIYHGLAPIESEYVSQDGRLIQKNKYRSMSVETIIESGEKGIKIFRYTDGEFPDIDEQEAEEERLSKEQGRNVRIVYMNPTTLKNKKYRWFIVVNPTPKSNDKLSQLLFIQNIRTGFDLFGPDSFNMEYVKQRYAIIIDEDYNKLFKQMDIMEMLMQSMGQGGGADMGAEAGRAPQRTPGKRPQQALKAVVR